MTKEQLIKNIQDELTVSGSLPANLPDKEISRLIDQARSRFLEDYQYSAQRERFVILINEFTNNRNFLRTKTMLLPPEVISVTSIHECAGSRKYTTHLNWNRYGQYGSIYSGYGSWDSAAMTDSQFRNANVMYSRTMRAVDINRIEDNIVLNIADNAFYSLTGMYNTNEIAYDYNKNNKLLKFEGKMPQHDVVLEAWISISPDKLYDDYLFVRYCTAQSKVSYARMLSLYNFKLPGGIEMNPDMLRTEGESELEQIVTKIDEQNVCDWFYTY